MLRLSTHISDLDLTKFPSTDDVKKWIKDATMTQWWEYMLYGLEGLSEVSQTGYIYYLQTQIQAIYEVLAAHDIIETTSAVMSKGTVGSLFSGIASKFGRSANFLKEIARLYPNTANTIGTVADGLQYVADNLNSYNGIIQPFKDLINNINGYTKVLEDCLELEDLGGSCLPDVVEAVTNGISSCTNIAGA